VEQDANDDATKAMTTGKPPDDVPKVVEV